MMGRETALHVLHQFVHDILVHFHPFIPSIAKSRACLTDNKLGNYHDSRSAKYKRQILRDTSHSQLALRAPLHIESPLNMQFRPQIIVAHLFVALLLSTCTHASPTGTVAVKDAELICQICGIWPGAGNACCSASCILLHADFQGGYCNDSKHVP